MTVQILILDHKLANHADWHRRGRYHDTYYNCRSPYSYYALYAGV